MRVTRSMSTVKLFASIHKQMEQVHRMAPKAGICTAAEISILANDNAVRASDGNYYIMKFQ